MFAIRSSKNRVVNSDLTVTYEVEKVDYTDSSTSATGSWYRVTRHASKTYAYVDMTQVGAMNCANDMVALYTRQCAILDKRESGDTVPDVITVGQLQSSITPTRETGNAWRVDITVSETDTRASATLPSDPSSLFSVENARDYDEGSDDFEITAQSYNTDTSVLTLTVSNSLTTDERNRVMFLYKLSPNAADWSLRAVGTGLTWASSNTLSFTDNVSLVSGQSVVALRYGNLMTNTVTVTIPPIAPVINLVSNLLSTSSNDVTLNLSGNAAGIDLVSDAGVIAISTDGGVTEAASAFFPYGVSITKSGTTATVNGTGAGFYDTLLDYYQQGISSGVPTQIRVDFIDSEAVLHSTNWQTLTAA